VSSKPANPRRRVRTLGVPIGADPDHIANEYLHATSEYCDHSSWGPALVRIHTLPGPTLPRQDPSDESSQEFRDGNQKFESSSCGVEMLAGGEARLPYLHGKPLPGRRHQVMAASRRSRAREQREPLPGGGGPAPWRQAGGDTGHHRSPPRVRPSRRRHSGTLVLLQDAPDLPDHRRIDALPRRNQARSQALPS
jgi:hypothetical protein